MNKRIYALGRQATIWCCDNVDYSSPEEWEVAWEEKFADLLVDDIIKVLEGLPSQYQDYRSQIEESMQNYCIQSIINHFKDEK